jgi:hypothetical protein
VDGIEVDLPVYKWSQKMVVRAKQAGLLWWQVDHKHTPEKKF